MQPNRSFGHNSEATNACSSSLLHGNSQKPEKKWKTREKKKKKKKKKDKGI